jgi:hypothetical protein
VINKTISSQCREYAIWQSEQQTSQDTVLDTEQMHGFLKASLQRFDHLLLLAVLHFYVDPLKLQPMDAEVSVE